MTKRQHFHIRQGETWTRTYVHLDSAGSAVDLTSYSARMSVKSGFESSAEVYLSTGADADGGTIALDGSGNVTMSMTAAQSAALAGDLSTVFLTAPVKRAERFVDFIYDLELIDGDGNVTRALSGLLRVEREVTT